MVVGTGEEYSMRGGVEYLILVGKGEKWSLLPCGIGVPYGDTFKDDNVVDGLAVGDNE